MELSTSVTFAGNLTADPELRYTRSGQAVVNFTVAATTRVFDRDADCWKDADTTFLRATAWRGIAQNIAESVHKGDRVVVIGRLTQNSYETKEGEKRTSYDLAVDEFGVSLRYATAALAKNRQGSAPSGNGRDGDEHNAAN